ncbi:MAG: TrkH family potassium uptake protein [Selenomonadaceae bacterium]|nr:TrkH family potassium uptake protein [Selenomonadaceae bacterium]
MNLRLVSAILGYLTLACGAAMLPPLLLAGFLNESAAASFLLSMLLCLGVAFELERYGAVTDQDNLSVREGIAITGLGWLLVSLLGMFPYFTGGYLNLLDSIVESVSGFSGTGATVIEDVEILPKSILLWRSLSNWVGGLGIIVIFMAILPSAGRGAVYMFRAESTGPTHERQMPHIRDNAKALFRVYVVFTAVCAIAYWLCGLSPFPAVNHAMTTIATGGYSIYNGAVMDYGNLWLEGCMSFFMVLSSGSFAMYVMTWRHGWGGILRNTEFRAYLWIIAVAAVMISIDLIVEMKMDVVSALRYSVFQVASLSSTTGFVSYDFDTWPPLAKGLLMMTMFLGGCAGSTAGGLKVSRIVLLFRMVLSIVWQKVHPQAMKPVKMNGQPVPDDVLYGVARFFFAYVMLDVLFALVMLLDGIDLIDAVSVSISTMGSVGPGFGIEGATSTYALLPDFSRACACIFMFLARLEIFTVIAMLTPEFWSREKGW